ncbi:hypothetical protein [Caballeronia grimmiae]|uniref:hypothetical protein n=1 Tax=Caballeronia grimmiae TaxID=1071679 RepID=UPI0012697716|nr:hypothetical protein [Caballeronia grimmiae]
MFTGQAWTSDATVSIGCAAFNDAQLRRVLDATMQRARGWLQSPRASIVDKQTVLHHQIRITIGALILAIGYRPLVLMYRTGSKTKEQHRTLASETKR